LNEEQLAAVNELWEKGEWKKAAEEQAQAHGFDADKTYRWVRYSGNNINDPKAYTIARWSPLTDSNQDRSSLGAHWVNQFAQKVLGIENVVTNKEGQPAQRYVDVEMPDGTVAQRKYDIGSNEDPNEVYEVKALTKPDAVNKTFYGSSGDTPKELPVDMQHLASNPQLKLTWVLIGFEKIEQGFVQQATAAGATVEHYDYNMNLINRWKPGSEFDQMWVDLGGEG
jgi:hypothetical protein